MKSGFKQALPALLFSFLKYIPVHRLLYPFYGGNGLILVLHRVRPESGRVRVKANSRIEITPEFMEELILYFKKIKYDIISLDELIQRLGSTDKSDPFVCFTFDDGYADAHEFIYPIFKKHQVPYCVYVTTCFPDRTVAPWWYMLEDLLLQHDLIQFSWKQKEYVYNISDLSEKETAYTDIRNIVLSTPVEELDDFIQTVFVPYGIFVSDYEHHQMSWEQVAELSRDPLVTVGAHTVHHLNLKQLSAEQVKKEIIDSKVRIEEKTGCPVGHFAYPFGSRVEVGKRECEIAASCGFKTMTTVREGTIFPAHRDHTECLPRVEITGRHQNVTLVDLRRCGVIALLRNGFRPVVTL